MQDATILRFRVLDQKKIVKCSSVLEFGIIGLFVDLISWLQVPLIKRLRKWSSNTGWYVRGRKSNLGARAI